MKVNRIPALHIINRFTVIMVLWLYNVYILFYITSYITYRVYYYVFRDDSYVANVSAIISDGKIRLGPIRRETGMYA